MKNNDIQGFYQVNPKYIEELYFLQVELLKLQKFIHEKKLRVAILFEGRDAAGKGSAINRFTQFLNPRMYNIHALGKPTKKERGQWYFQRYIKRLPDAGEMTFFDRSWYNRAVVEPAMGFCTDKQYDSFMQQVAPFEKLIIDDGIILVKFWFSIDMDTQKERINKRISSPLQQWKVSPVDLAATEKWESFSFFKQKMFEQTSTALSPWIRILGADREYCRIQAMRYVLSLFDYKEKSIGLEPYDNSIVKIQ